ncbi:MAG: methylated-DNA--[Desulfovibrio sp.]|nr:methylated-DNA--[protein]-cysteine S-methyltransferase [Desulfovibrio sp.]
MERLYCRLPIVGLTCLEATPEGLRAVRFVDGEDNLCPTCTGPLVREAARQLEGWLCKRLRCFDLPLAPTGTPFQQEVWQALRAIPYGQTRSYKAVATALGRPGACRAVGMANNRNPLSIVIPCHRVIGANGHLVGYGGGLWRKAALLRLEGSLL